MKNIQTDKAPQAIGPYSQAIQMVDLVYTSGQIPLRPDGTMVEGDIEVQTKQVMENLTAVLEASDSSLTKVVKTTIFLTNLGDFDKVNAVYGQYFSEHQPARSCVQVAALPKGARIEIEAVATL